MTGQSRRAPVRLVRLMLNLFPAGFRQRYGPDLLGNFEEAWSEASARGRVAAAACVLRTAGSLLVSAVHERFAALRGESAIGAERGARGSALNNVAQDARYALRAIRRDRRFYLFATLIIGLGVGASTAVFGVMSPLLLRPLPFESADRLVWVANIGGGGLSSVTSRSSNLRDYRTMNRSFDGLTGYFAFFDYGSYTLSGESEPERLVGVGVAQDFLDVLRVRVVRGRNFVDEEGVWGGRRAAILTHAFWMRRFAGDPGIVGRSITLNGEPTEVVGILPASFDFASTFTPGTAIDFLWPFPISDETDAWGNTLSIIGRLKPGVTVEAAQADLDPINRQLQEADPARWGLNAIVSPLQEQIAGRFRFAMLVLAAAAAAVMVIVCANLSNLLLAKAPGRAKEMAVRSVLGATRGRLVSQLLLESFTLALSGALIGLLIAYAATRAVSATTARSIPLLHTVGLDLRAIGFAAAIAAVTALLMGIVPALRLSDGKQGSAMRESGRRTGESREHTRLRELFVIAEVALACVLLVSGGLLLRSFVRLLDVELGFEPSGVAAWRVASNQRFENLAAWNAFYDRLISEVQAVPGVEAAGLTDTMPLGRNRGWGIGAQGVLYEAGQRPGFFPRMVDWRYLGTMRIPLLRGRYFDAHDTGDDPGVIILNEVAARRLFPERDAVGQTVVINGSAELQVVGVVADVRHQSLEEGSGLEGYMPITQTQAWGALDMVVRSSIPVASIVPGVRAALRSVDPTMPSGDYETLDDIVNRTVSPRRFVLQLLGVFAATALLLAALGIYGVVSYSVTQRIPEIGVRIALGESGGRVLGRVLGRTLMLAAVGVTAGAAGAFVASRWIASLLYGVEPTDPLSFAAVAGLLLVVAAFAGYLPARRASRTPPAIALQSV